MSYLKKNWLGLIFLGVVGYWSATEFNALGVGIICGLTVPALFYVRWLKP